MGGRYTESQKSATIKYLKEKTDDIRIRVPKGGKPAWKDAAAARGKSLNQFIIDCVTNEIGGPSK